MMPLRFETKSEARGELGPRLPRGGNVGPNELPQLFQAERPRFQRGRAPAEREAEKRRMAFQTGRFNRVARSDERR